MPRKLHTEGHAVIRMDAITGQQFPDLLTVRAEEKQAQRVADEYDAHYPHFDGFYPQVKVTRVVITWTIGEERAEA